MGKTENLVGKNRFVYINRLSDQVLRSVLSIPKGQRLTEGEKVYEGIRFFDSKTAQNPMEFVFSIAGKFDPEKLIEDKTGEIVLYFENGTNRYYHLGIREETHILSQIGTIGMFNHSLDSIAKLYGELYNRNIIPKIFRINR